MLGIVLGVAALIVLVVVGVIILRMVAWFAGYVSKILKTGLTAIVFVAGPFLFAVAIFMGTWNLQYAGITFFVLLAILVVWKVTK